MGRISSSEPLKQTITNHVSHEHPLSLINHQPQQILNTSSCAGCKLQPSGLIYSCTTCAFFLHKNCFEMPKKITHPCHKEHSFTLLPQPAYPNGLFKCDACGENGASGFSYRCKPCGIDMHILCAVMPLSVSHAFHAHKLELTFESPYPTKDFSCDVCKINGSNHWLYRCDACGFDAHLNCAIVVPQAHLSATTSRSPPLPQVQGYLPHFTAANHYPIQQNPFLTATGFPAAAPCMPHYGINNTNEMATHQAIQQMIHNNNALKHAILQANRSGGIGNNRGLHHWMQLVSGLNNGGGGGGGGVPGMNAFGSGGGQDFAQALMNSGGGVNGGGGTDFMSLLGGGNGSDFLGGGGSDLLGGLLGGGLSF